MRRICKRAEGGGYMIKGKHYDKCLGSRAEVGHGTAYKTSGGLVKSNLKQNKHGRWVSLKLSKRAKSEKRLEKAGYFTQKGKFGFVKKESGKGIRTKRRKHSKKHHRRRRSTRRR